MTVLDIPGSAVDGHTTDGHTTFVKLQLTSCLLVEQVYNLYCKLTKML